MKPYVETIYRDPFTIGTPTTARLRTGLNVAQMVKRMRFLPPDFAETGTVRINDGEVPRALWELVKPKATSEAKPINVTFHAAIRGQTDEDGKNSLALVATIVVSVAAIVVSGPVGAGFLGSQTAALVAGAVISIAGTLLITALTPPPVTPSTPDPSAGPDRDKRGAASAGGNILEPNGPIPRVIGTRKIFPPLAAEPFTFFDGEDEIVEAVYALAGPHDLTEIKIDGTPIAEATDVVFQSREGWFDDLPLDIVKQQTRTTPARLRLSSHKILPDRQDVLSGIGVEDLPTFHGTASKKNTDEILLHFVFAQGLGKTKIVGGQPEIQRMRVPLRIRIRKAGDSTWRNIPELHYENATFRDARVTVKLKFQDGENSVIPGAPITAAFVEARKEVPGQTAFPTTDGWSADAYFSSGAGDDFLTIGTEGSTNVLNVTITQTEANVFLDTAQFSPGIYEIEVERGNAFLKDDFVSATYFYDDGTDDDVHDFFFWRTRGGDQVIPQSHENVIDTMTFLRTVSVWNERPVNAGDGFALLAIRARNRRVDNVSIKASGYVKDWDGSGWNTWVTTSNPAAHFRDVLVGRLNLDALPEALINETSLTEWRTANTSLDYSCDHIAEGERIGDVLSIMGGCAFARPYQSEEWGITRDFDRSADDPIQIFSPRNSNGFRFSKAFSRLPDGIRLNFKLEDEDFTPQQLIVYHNDVVGPKLEQVTYQGLVTLAKVRRRAEFDLQQARDRATFYSLEVPAESVVCRRGSLVGVTHDTLHNQSGFGRISTVQISGPNVTGITLDSDVPVFNEGGMDTITDMSAVTDMSLIGRTTGAAIRHTDGAISVHLLSNATGETDVLTFDTPVTNSTWAGGPFDSGVIPVIDEGCLVVTGDFGVEFRRLIVSEMRASEDLKISMTLLDEAPGLWGIAVSLLGSLLLEDAFALLLETGGKLLLEG